MQIYIMGNEINQFENLKVRLCVDIRRLLGG